MYCKNCGHHNEDNNVYCVNCAFPLKISDNSSEPSHTYPSCRKSEGLFETRYAEGKNPVIAMVLSLLLVGSGQIYNGDCKKGAYMLIGAIILGFFSIGFFWFVLAVWSAVDAYQVANCERPLWKD